MTTDDKNVPHDPEELIKELKEVAGMMASYFELWITFVKADGPAAALAAKLKELAAR